MATLTLNYGSIESAYKAMGDAAKKCTDRADDIKTKITQKFGALEMGSNGNTSSAESYLNKKMNELNRKHDVYDSYSKRIDDFLNGPTGAKEVDKKVASSIKTQAVQYREMNGMQTGFFDEMFAWLGTVWDSTGFGRWLSQIFTDIGNWIKEVKFWYKCEGGKYVLKIVGAVLLLVAAVIVLIVAWPVMLAAFAAFAAGTATLWAAIVAGAAVVGAIIGIINAVVNVVFECKALAAYGTDPGWAQRYSSFDSAATFLNKNRFESDILFISKDWLNKASYTAATVIQVIEVTCAIIAVADLVKNGITFIAKGGLKNLFKPFKNSGFKDALNQNVLNKKDFPKIKFTNNGKFSFSSLKSGTGALIKNINSYTKGIFGNPELGFLTSKVHGLARANSAKPLAGLYKFGTTSTFVTSFKKGHTAFKAFDSFINSGPMKAATNYVKGKFTIFNHQKTVTGLVDGIKGLVNP